MMGELKSHTCSFCGQTFPLIEGMTYRVATVEFEPNKTENSDGIIRMPIPGYHSEIQSIRECIFLSFYFCPNCKQTSVFISSVGGTLQQNIAYRYPAFKIQQYPDYIPLQIRNDYSEAGLIIDLSAKASATLSRRCLQGIIRNYWGINEKFWSTHIEIKAQCNLKDPSKANLFQEIKAVEAIGGIGAPIIEAFKQLKDIGNIGAHPEKEVDTIVDVEPQEAETMLSLIELIIRMTYIQRHDDEELLLQVKAISEKKTTSEVTTNETSI